MRSWKAEASQKALLSRLPFDGVKHFGPQLEELLKSVEDRKILTPMRPAGRDQGLLTGGRLEIH